MERWFVLSNCQTQGLAHSLSLLCDRIDVEFCDVTSFRNQPDHWAHKIASVDRVVVSPEFSDTDLDMATVGDRVILVPTIYFGGFHPDQCLLFEGDSMFRGCIGSYHSTIAYTAFRKGKSVRDACALFNAGTYRRLGYFDVWPRWEAFLTSSYAAYGLDISRAVRRWCLGRSFMHTSHHPKIDCLYDLAHILLAANGRQTQESDIRPFDNLVVDTCFPVYPEIARELGFRGSYQFKPPGSFQCLDLERFVTLSFDAYSAHDTARLMVDAPNQPAFDRLMAML